MPILLDIVVEIVYYDDHLGDDEHDDSKDPNYIEQDTYPDPDGGERFGPDPLVLGHVVRRISRLGNHSVSVTGRRV